MEKVVSAIISQEGGEGETGTNHKHGLFFSEFRPQPNSDFSNWFFTMLNLETNILS